MPRNPASPVLSLFRSPSSRTRLRGAGQTALQAVTRETLKSAAAVHRRTNAFIELNGDAALQAAGTLSPGSHEPLHGLPVGLKDMFDFAGRRCTYGSALHQDAPAQADAAVVERLKAAGALIIGFLNMSEFALGPTGHNRTFGHCRNPIDPERISGGSSSGAAAAVGSGVLFGAVGSDTGGSIRIPAACCGVVGLKPTQGAVSTQGAMALSPSLDCVGPLAATVSDCERMFAVLADPAPISPVSRGTEPVRWAMPSKPCVADVDADIAAVLDRIAATLSEAGETPVMRALPDRRELHGLADVIQASEVAAVHADRVKGSRGSYTPSVLKRIDPGFALPATRYVDAIRERPARLAQFVEQTLADADVLVIPTLGEIVPTIAATDEEALGNVPELVVRMTAWTRWLNYLGVPALNLPAGRDRNGMPVGVQLVARPSDEATLFRAGSRLEELLAVPPFRLASNGN